MNQWEIGNCEHNYIHGFGPIIRGLPTLLVYLACEIGCLTSMLSLIQLLHPRGGMPFLLDYL